MITAHTRCAFMLWRALVHSPVFRWTLLYAVLKPGGSLRPKEEPPKELFFDIMKCICGVMVTIKTIQAPDSIIPYILLVVPLPRHLYSGAEPDASVIVADVR